MKGKIQCISAMLALKKVLRFVWLFLLRLFLADSDNDDANDSNNGLNGCSKAYSEASTIEPRMLQGKATQLIKHIQRWTEKGHPEQGPQLAVSSVLINSS